MFKIIHNMVGCHCRVKIKTLQINLNQLEFKDVLLNVLLLYKILKKGGTLL